MKRIMKMMFVAPLMIMLATACKDDESVGDIEQGLIGSWQAVEYYSNENSHIDAKLNQLGKLIRYEEPSMAPCTGKINYVEQRLDMIELSFMQDKKAVFAQKGYSKETYPSFEDCSITEVDINEPDVSVVEKWRLSSDNKNIQIYDEEYDDDYFDAKIESLTSSELVLVTWDDEDFVRIKLKRK